MYTVQKMHKVVPWPSWVIRELGVTGFTFLFSEGGVYILSLAALLWATLSWVRYPFPPAESTGKFVALHGCRTGTLTTRLSAPTVLCYIRVTLLATCKERDFGITYWGTLAGHPTSVTWPRNWGAKVTSFASSCSFMSFYLPHELSNTREGP